MGIKKLPRKAEWRERDNNTMFRGTVVDEVSVVEEFDFGDYCKMVQLIETENGNVIRFGYYIKPHGSPDSEYTWGSQTTLVVRPENARKLLDEANKRGFF